MTRFARAKGSKASNERVPEEATSWQEMKQQIEDKKLEVEESKKRKKAEEMRKKNYKNFLEELENTKEESWTEFENDTKLIKKKKDVGDIDEGFEELAGKKDGEFKKESEEVNESNKKKRKRSGGALKDNSTEEKVKKNKNKKDKNENNKSDKGNQPKQNQTVKKPYSELTEEEKMKVDKKRARRARQMEKRKQAKAGNLPQKDQSENNPPGENRKRKLPKIRDDKEHKRRKPDSQQTTMNINGVEVNISYFDGFPIKSEDATRLQKLKKEMISKGIPRSEIQVALKLERRKAEKALAREKKKVCFNCRKSGHVLSECPNLNESKNQESIGSGVCFKCGSTEHTHFDCKVIRGDNFKFATCFICKEQGHISRQCPDNDKGLYPKGGACKVCGDVTHLKKDCPKYQAQQEALNIQVDSLNFDNVESLDSKSNEKGVMNAKPNKLIKF